MTISIPNSTLLATEVSELEDYRKLFSIRDREGSTFVSLDRVSSEAFADLIRAAKLAGDTRTSRALNALQLARQGQIDVKVPNFKAFAGMLQAYLAHEVIDGWIYVESHDGKLYPELVTRVTFHPESHRQEQAMVSIQTTSYSLTGYNSNTTVGTRINTHSFYPSMVTNKRVADVLAAAGIFKETAELREDYDASIGRFHKEVRPGFAGQFRFTGQVFSGDRSIRELVPMADRKVVHDLRGDEYRSRRAYEESCLLNPGDDQNGAGVVPEHPIVRVFDLRSHQSYW